MIEQLLPNRSRRQIKNKFKREERENAARVEHVLGNPLPIGTAHQLCSLVLHE